MVKITTEQEGLSTVAYVTISGTKDVAVNTKLTDVSNLLTTLGALAYEVFPAYGNIYIYDSGNKQVAVNMACFIETSTEFLRPSSGLWVSSTFPITDMTVIGKR